MRDDNTEPRDNQQIADDSQQSEVDMSQREAEEIANRPPEDEPDSPYRVPPGGNRAGNDSGS